MTQPTSVPVAQAGEAFAGAARRPRLRERVSTVDQLMTVVAAVLLPLGLVVVFFGWYGAARTPYLFEQLPYLASGGLIGLGLIAIGGFVLFGSWIARTAREQALRDQTLIAAVHELRDELTRLRLAVPDPQPAPPAQRGRRKAPAVVQTHGGAGDARALVATARGSMLHRADCAIVTGRDDVHAVSDPDAEGLRPCRLCDPLGAAPARA
jgi:uncharacterized membrane protein